MMNEVRPCISRSNAGCDSAFGFGVDRRGRVVQDQDARVLEQVRAIATRCRWPAEKVTPFSPTSVL